MKRYFNKENGYGDIITETEHYYVIRWDKYPDTYEQVVKPECVDDFLF